MTNAEWIRSLNDNELAIMFFEFCKNTERCYYCPLFEEENEDSCGGSLSGKQWFEWMKKERV